RHAPPDIATSSLRIRSTDSDSRQGNDLGRGETTSRTFPPPAARPLSRRRVRGGDRQERLRDRASELSRRLPERHVAREKPHECVVEARPRKNRRERERGHRGTDSPLRLFGREVLGQALPPLTIPQILQWAEAHHHC